MSYIPNEKNISRRKLLGASGKLSASAIGAMGFPIVLTNKGYAYTNDPEDGKSVYAGANIPMSGAYSQLGQDQLNAFKLAVKHINGGGDGGMLNTLQPLSLTGQGINGKKLELIIGDTRTSSEVAARSAKNMIDYDHVSMISGGASSSVAMAVQDICQDAGIMFMAGDTNSNDTTGKNRRANGFRHYMNAYMSAGAVAPVLAKNYGNDRNVYFLTVDYNWGHSIEAVMRQFLESLGWNTVGSVLTPIGNENFDDAINQIKNSDADFLILNQFDEDLVNSLNSAHKAGLFETLKNGKKFDAALPLHSRSSAVSVGDKIKGLYGALNWHWTLTDPGSKAFLMSFGQEYGYPPSETAHTCYVQMLLWANACQQAGTFDPCGVVEALEGLEFTGTGDLDAEYRKSDHQCLKSVIVAQGKPEPISNFDLLEVVSITPRVQLEFNPNGETFAGDLGSCNSGS